MTSEEKAEYRAKKAEQELEDLKKQNGTRRHGKNSPEDAVRGKYQRAG